MAKPKRKKPTDPQAAARHRLEREENRREIERLKAQGDVEINLDPRTKKLLSARRVDCFSTLLRDHAHAREAVNWLEELMRDAYGENAQERRPDFIRASSEGAPGQTISQRMIEASKVLEVVEASLRPWEARLLFGLLRPDEALQSRWREVVRRVTGVRNEQRQGERVVCAAESLLWTRENIAGLLRAHSELRKAA